MTRKKKMITRFRCTACGKLTAGRIGRDRGYRGDTSARYPRRHKINGKVCAGVFEEAEWIDSERAER